MMTMMNNKGGRRGLKREGRIRELLTTMNEPFIQYNMIEGEGTEIRIESSYSAQDLFFSKSSLRMLTHVETVRGFSKNPSPLPSPYVSQWRGLGMLSFR